MDDDDLRRYARLILDVGVALQPGQDLAVNALLAHAPFARLLVDEAYRRGAALVDVWYWDPHTKRSRIAHASRASLTRTPDWLGQRCRLLAERGGALVNLAGDPEPGLLRDVDPERAGLDRMPALASRYEIQARNEVQWCWAPVPSAGWAKQVFGEADVGRLWRELTRVLHLDAADPAQAWRLRLAVLEERCAELTDRRFAELRYRGPGTQLRVFLPPRHRWATSRLLARSGVRHVATLPTEEVFTSPDPARTTGTVRATRPLALGGTLVEGLELTFADGRITEVRALRGADVVRAQLAIDDGAARLGEAALVDDTSPLQRSGVVFHDTLLDESAASHLAWGSGIPDGHLDYDSRRPETLDRLPVNRSSTHVDFMVGGADVSVAGVDDRGEEHPILDGERWVL